MSMKNASTVAPAPPVTVDAPTVAAVLEAAKKTETLAKIRQHGGLRETPALIKLIGPTPIPLRHILGKIRTEFSVAAKIDASPEDVLAPGTFLLLDVGDLDLVANAPDLFAYASAEEAKDAVTVQDAIRFRSAERPARAAEALVVAAQRDLARKQDAVAVANKARENAESILGVATNSSDAEGKKFSEFVAAYGEGGEEKLRAAVASLAPPPAKPEPKPRVFTPADVAPSKVSGLGSLVRPTEPVGVVEVGS